MKESTIKRKMRSKNSDERLAIVSQSWDESDEQIEWGLSDEDWMVRIAWFRRCGMKHRLTSERARRGLSDPHDQVRATVIGIADAVDLIGHIHPILEGDDDTMLLALLRNHRWTATQPECAAGIRHANDRVRVAWLRRHDTTLTHEDVELLITDPEPQVRVALAKCNGFVATDDQVERGLRDEHPYLRAAWLKRPGVRLTEEQIERALTDDSELVRHTIIDLKTWTPTTAQIDRGLSRGEADVWCFRRDVAPSSKAVIFGLQHHEPRVRRRWATRLDYSATAELALIGIQDDAQSDIWISRKDYPVARDHFDAARAGGLAIPIEWWWRITEDPSSNLVTAAIKRHDFRPVEPSMKAEAVRQSRTIYLALGVKLRRRPTIMQWNMAMEHRCPLVRWLWSQR